MKKSLRGMGLSLVMLALAVSAANADRRKARAFYDEGLALYTLGRYDEAIGKFESGFLEDRRPAFLFNIAQAHKAAGRMPQAVVFYKRYLELLPEAPDRAAVEQLLRLMDTPGSPVAQGVGGAVAANAPVVAPAQPPAPPHAVATVASLSAAPGSDELLGLPAEALEDKRPALAVAPSPSGVDAAPAAPPPVYKRWWLWAVVGGVVAVGAGTGIGVAAAGPNDATVPNSALGSATLRF